MQFEDVLRTWNGFFQRESIRYAVAGGLAIHAWGHSRSTHDIDFAIDGHAHDRAIAFAESVGYITLYASEGYSNHEHPDRVFGRVDLMYLYGSTADQVFAHAAHRLVAGTTETPVPKPEHPIAMKCKPTKMRRDASRSMYQTSNTC